MYRSRIKPKAQTPANLTTLQTPENSVKKVLGVTQCRRIGLSRKKVVSSPNTNTFENKTPTSSQEICERSSQPIKSSFESDEDAQMKITPQKKESLFGEQNETTTNDINDTILKTILPEISQNNSVENSIGKLSILQNKRSKPIRKRINDRKSNLEKSIESSSLPKPQKLTSPQKNLAEKSFINTNLVKNTIKSSETELSEPQNNAVKRTISELDETEKTCKKYKLDELEKFISNNLTKSEDKSYCESLQGDSDILIGFDKSLQSVTAKNNVQKSLLGLDTPKNNIEIASLTDNKKSKEQATIFDPESDILSPVHKNIVKEDIEKSSDLNSNKNSAKPEEQKVSLKSEPRPHDSKVLKNVENNNTALKKKIISDKKYDCGPLTKKVEQNVSMVENIGTPKTDTKRKIEKFKNYFDDSDSDFEELTPVSRKIYQENRKSEIFEKNKSKSITKKIGVPKETKSKSSNSKTSKKPVSQISKNILNLNIQDSKKSFERNRSILLDDDDDDLFLPKK